MNKTFHSVLNSIKNYSWSSLFFKYWKMLMIYIMMPFIAINILTYYYYNKVFNIEINSTLSQNFLQTTNSVNNIFKEIEKSFILFSTNNYIISYIASSYKKTYPQESDIILSISGLMNNFINTSNYMDSIHLYTLSNNYVLSTRNSNLIDQFYDKTWYEEYLKTKNTNFVVFSKSAYSKIVPDTLSICYGIYINNEISGILVFNIDVNKLYNTILGNRGSLAGNFLLTNQSGTIIYSTNSIMIDQNIDSVFNLQYLDDTNQNNIDVKRTKNNIYLKTKLDNMNYFAISEVNLKQFKNGINNVGIIILLCILFVVLIPLLISFYLSIQFYKSIAEITAQFQDETTTTLAPGKQFNELLFINNNILNIINNKKNVEATLAEKIIKLKKAQSMALQMQFNPHFLFNTLNLVNVLVMKDTKSDSDSGNVIALLSDLLYGALDTKKYMVSINDEILYAKKYIEIESIKQANNFDIIWNVDKELLDCKIIKLILQPIIENAFEHGIRLLKDNKRGVLNISVQASNKDIIISVYNNGPKIKSEKLCELKNQLSSGELPETKQVGLCNVNERIKLIFGENYGCNISSSENGTTVDIIIQNLK